MRYVDVIVDSSSEYTDTPYTYSAPDDISIGDKVTVSFARRKKTIDGYVFDVDVIPDIDAGRIKSVDSVDKRRSLNREMIDTASWMVERYGIKSIDAVKMFTVSGKREAGDKELKLSNHAEIDYELTSEQKNAIETINDSMVSGGGTPILIKGVTNSGKTEVYMQSAAKAIESGKTVIILVPEIALSYQIADRFRDRFGAENVATLHSKLTTSKKLEEWLRIRDGRARIVVGARTAIFAPLENIGLIVIDEEHETTYKSDHNPKYETIDIAYRRAKYHGATLVMGSATPSVVSYSRAKDGIYRLIEMKDRIGQSRLPDIDIVDMREELRLGNTTLFSRKLYDRIAETINRGEQTILFLNRRGFSTQVICQDCGDSIKCSECGISMTYHKSENGLVCHYCGRKHPVPNVCPECGSYNLKFIGSGTEKVEEQANELFPDSKIARFDLDTAGTQRDIDGVVNDFMKGKTDILVGTQILAKGLDFQNVGLVGVVMADTTLTLPDYRSSERTFQLITQVAGRAGRNKAQSNVIIQTYVPGDDVILSAAAGDYEAFYDIEMLHRKNMNYPPFSDIIEVSFVGKKGKDAGTSELMSYADDFRSRLLSMRDAPADATIFEPREDSIKIPGGRSRVQFMIKAPKGSRSGYTKAYRDYKDWMIASGADCYIELDVNPY